MIRRAAVALALSTLALTTIAADGESGAFASVDDLTVVAENGTITVTGRPTFGGGEPISITDGGSAPAPGFGIAGATIHQAADAQELTFTMDVVGSFAPGAQYMIPLGVTGLGDNQLLAYANTTQDFVFQLANFDDGYGSTEISGSVAGTTITWNLPISALGTKPGATVFAGLEPLHTAAGVSQAGNSLNAGCCVAIDEATWTADDFVIGGGMTVEIIGDGVDETLSAKVRRGEATASLDGLPAGTYTVTVISRFADASFEEVFTVTL